MAVTPAVGISKEQGLMVIVRPAKRVLKVEVLAVKIHEPKVMGPVAVLPVKVSVTVKLEPEKLMVVGPVVPSSATPDAKLTVRPLRACKNAGPVVGLMAMLVLLEATGTGTTLLPPPQAASKATEEAKNRVCKVFDIFMVSLFQLTWILGERFAKPVSMGYRVVISLLQMHADLSHYPPQFGSV